MNSEIYDVIVIGVNAGGVSAAMQTAKNGLSTLILGKTAPIDREGLKHLNKEVVHAKQDEMIEGKPTYMVKTADLKEFKAKSLIIAVGIKDKTSGAEGEEKFKRKGVHYCVSCDGFFYRNKKVAVIGGENLAAEEALEFEPITKDVVLISQNEKFEITPELKGELEKHKIEMITGRVKEIRGEERVNSLLMEDGKEIEVAGVFIAMGMASGIDFSNKLGIIMDQGEFNVDENGKTNLQGVYAADKDGEKIASAITKYIKGE